MTNAEARIRSIIERILRLKDEQDALGADIREIYKEAAGEGFNKTALGSVVTLVRKRAKDGDKLAALEADVALYLSAYDGTPIAPTRMRATAAAARKGVDPKLDTPHDSDGVVIEPAAPEVPSAPSQGLNGGQPCKPSPDAVPAADDTTPHTASSDSGQSERAPASIPVQSHIIREPAAVEGNPPPPAPEPQIPAPPAVEGNACIPATREIGVTVDIPDFLDRRPKVAAV